MIKNGELVNTGYDTSVAYVVGTGESLEEAIDNAMENMKDVIFQDMYWRTDLKSEEWYSMINRYRYLLEKKWI